MAKLEFNSESGIVREKANGLVTYVVNTDVVQNYRKAIEMIREDAGSRGLLHKRTGTEVQINGSKQDNFLDAYENLMEWLNNRTAKSEQEAMDEEGLSSFSSVKPGSLRDKLSNLLYPQVRKFLETEFSLGLRALETDRIGDVFCSVVDGRKVGYYGYLNYQ